MMWRTFLNAEYNELVPIADEYVWGEMEWEEHVNNPSGSPVEVVCDKGCYVLVGTLWKEQLSGIQDSIVFIDEGNEFVKTDEFAREIQRTDNYYVIVSREGLPSLPYK